jgi:hypothetical protein
LFAAAEGTALASAAGLSVHLLRLLKGSNFQISGATGFASGKTGVLLSVLHKMPAL